ncbi:Flap endonuclease GEN-like 2 [Striga hermonthica]|uniref:Flap endonuclease GEN-like 2 n=1 Tax=Striga hermonthica TaxID=68872 RepID=A0A9N7NQ08_STRHE|nr:Flap endonuclease GEN-like 2 [Striga hermonthica]
MGVKNLWDILESCKKILPLAHLQNKRVCVDLSCWMVQLNSACKSQCPLKDKIYLKGLFHRIRALIALNCSLIFVTDGSIPAIKVTAYRRRLNGGNEATLVAGNPPNVASLKRNKGSEFSCMIKEAKFLGASLGIPCLDGIEEAEAQCALLNSESLCDGCFTSDSDAFLFGARTVYRDICLGEGGHVVCYEMDDIERKLGFGRNSLESACQIVKSIGDSTVLQRFAAEGLSITKKPKRSKKKGHNLTNEQKENDNGNKCGLPLENQFLQVINAYLKPRCHSADSDIVHRVLALYPFNRSQLHQLCTQYFDWPPEKTDEYIMPKIAERNLRRFANLRSSSSRLGLHLPVNEMPVKCPVSSIVKQRKVQGRDYFEVSWEKMDGLDSSIVPADLVESACPEKIMEFHERKAHKQKPTKKKSRAVKVDMKSDTVDVHRKLQELLLDIERDRCTMNNGASCLVGLDYQQSAIMSLNYSESRGKCPLSSSSSSRSRSIGKDIIDLISPPPKQIIARGVSSFREKEFSDVIELSDTDNDVSPEHMRKAKELRMFIAKIRDEIS